MWMQAIGSVYCSISWVISLWKHLMTVENVREKSTNNKHFFWLFMAWGTVVGRFDHTCVRACSVFFFTARILFLAIHCSTHPVEFMAVSYIRIHLCPNPLFSYFSSSLSLSRQNGASPSSFTCNSEWEPHHAAYHPETEERYVKFVSCKEDGGPFSDILLSATQLTLSSHCAKCRPLWSSQTFGSASCSPPYSACFVVRSWYLLPRHGLG